LPQRQLDLEIEDPRAALDKAWSKTLEGISSEVSKPTFETFFRGSKPLSFESETLTLGTRTEFAKEWLERRYAPLIAKHSCGVLHPRMTIKVVLIKDPAANRAQRKPRRKAPSQGKARGLFDPIPLNEKFTFRNFVVGPSNRFAHAGASAVAQNPGETYNPLFIYGGVGIGKTHLMQSIGNHTLETDPGCKVAYVPGETFTHHYVTALRETSIDEFRNNYRSVDIWLVDDVQFIANKEKTEEEFFHTFELLHQLGKQIVVCSDRPPKDLHLLDSRLQSRFESGLVTDIRPPELETRAAILERKALAEGVVFPEEILMYLASVVDSHVRALEGALVKLMAYSSLLNAPLTLKLATEVVGEYFAQKAADLSPQMITKTVCDRMKVDPSQVRGKKRQRNILLARQVAMYLIRELLGRSLAEIGDEFGGKDHATVSHAQKRVRTLIKSDKEIKKLVRDLSTILKSGKF
jgi:chromosomal replication initiator protein